MFSRRTLTLAAGAATLALAGLGLGACERGAGGATGGSSSYELPSDVPVGSPDAKVVLVEYASITCPHCAAFNNNVKPQLKAEYIDTGLVRFVFREFPTPPVDLAMAGHMLAFCAGADKREAMLDTLFRQQMEIFQQAQGPGGPRAALLPVAAAAGVSEADFDACMANEEVLQRMRDVYKHGTEVDRVTGTPSLFINGQKFEGPGGREIAFSDLKPALDAALTAAGVTPPGAAAPAAPAAPAATPPAEAPAAPADKK